MSSSMDTDLLDSEVGLEYYSHDSELGEEGVEEGSEEEEDEEEEEEDEAMDETQTFTGKDGEMIESYDKRELITTEGDIYIEPCEGMEFDSEEAARAFYTAYARRAGFRVRVSKCRRSMHDGMIISRQFVCSKEGFYVEKNQDGNKGQDVITGVGCMARLVVRKQNSGKWLVTKFERDHNHDPVDPVALRKVHLKSLQVADVNKVQNSVQKMESPMESDAVFAPPQGDPNLEPHEGMEFQSEEAARTFYYAYAKDLGFTVRISKCRRARDGSIICRRFVCSKEGYYVRKYGRTKRSRALTRVGCLARLIVKKLDSGTWVVANFEKEHNHPPFVIGKELSYQPPKPTRRINRGVRASLEAPGGDIVAKSETETMNSQSSVTWRFNKLHQEGIKFAEEGASSVEIFNVAMFALKEATQKVVAAKKGIVGAPQVGAFVSVGNHGDNMDQINWATNSGNQPTSSNQQSLNDGRQAVSSGGLMLIQQPVNLVLVAPGLQNESSQATLAIKLPNGQALQASSENQQLNITVPVSFQKQMTPTGQRLDGNGSVGPSMSAGRKRKHRTTDDSMEHFDGNAAQSQGWNIVAGSNTGAGGNSNVAFSEAQVAALQAVAEAFNVPTMGATSSSALPIKVSPVSTELSEINRRFSESQETPRTPGPNPLVHAAAIAAGARIASPEVAASLIKAVQSRTAVHIRSGGSVPTVPKLPIRVGGESFSARSPGPLQSPNIHYIRTGGESSVPGSHEEPVVVVGRSGELQVTMEEQFALLNASLGRGDGTAGNHHHIIMENQNEIEQQHDADLALS